MAANNRKKSVNILSLSSLATWVVIGFYLLGSGLYYTWCKSQLHKVGKEIKTYEKRLAGLGNEMEVVQSRIGRLSSTQTLQERFDTGFVQLVPITQVEPSIAVARADDDEVRTISNPNRSPRP